MRSNRYAIFLIYNIKFNGVDFNKTIEFNGQKIELLITNYENSREIEEPFNGWIYNIITNDWAKNMLYKPSPLESVLVIIKKEFNIGNENNFIFLLRLCIQLSYYKPTLVSQVSECIPKYCITKPEWDEFYHNFESSKLEINTISFNKVIRYFEVLSKINFKENNVLKEIYKITGIDDVLIELLALYSFIEGFWHNYNSTSNTTASFNVMLNDYLPGKENKHERNKIIQKISNQNGLFRNAKIDDMRHILAHGIYKKYENEWTPKQWEALFNQRNLLVEIVLESLINRIEKENF